MLDLRFATHSSLSSRGRTFCGRGICFFWFLFVALQGLSAPAQESPKRPHITGIDHLRMYATDVEKSKAFYEKLYGVRSETSECFDTSNRCFTVGWFGHQMITLQQTPATPTSDLLAEISFRTDNVKQMRSYLVSKGVSVSKIKVEKYQTSKLESHFELRDPEGHSISFTQRFGYPIDDPGPGDPFFVEIIHAGFVVKDRSVIDHFYKDILGFRPYWHGGMKDNEDSWVAMQVPDGKEWVEYMLNISPTADHHTLGVMNHIALGVKDIQAPKAAFIKNGGTPGEEPKLGRDGKWQLNLYDPDDTRVEFMEFNPREKPCCSEFTGPHPGPKQ
ncbi:MAG TPA: VOC family protein [Candidatus Acidoferrum sp.]|nr:VOC family protein [Candidatus Acidoferrum sp.]